MTFRYALELAYRGTNYHGWQIQPNASSIQEEIERRLTQLNGNLPISVVGCGRTDTGVHATYYVLHFDSQKELDTEQLVFKLNKMLPEDISLFSAQLVSEEFHARFSPTTRTYHYFIHQKKNPFLLDSHRIVSEIDFEAMNRAARLLLGTQDFTSFSKLHTDVKTNICTVSEAKWNQVSESEWYFEIKADRFLRNMVRAVVGTLLEVGYGNLGENDITKIVALKDRGEAKLSVPAKGLFLVNIEYPENFLIRKAKRE
ncbi:tRNA pseudouridine(38-40) synthase TruA [Fluviicola taffensis]|uniref:tRNA pseudouridine synthase A n=1 Tax=Fluviicola taffensis (strain DSM 16823 / NCIMB 13979 / RW262) TaxID=755732 RepID=F2IBI6_FLUTR|nr:tRNA pseudouridine(38-40) synthase TruA [Fluviicola taffensis]AEA44294.1 tRNA pseudouridine synthase A [Fluviicola taffensis DSM 16823]